MGTKKYLVRLDDASPWMDGRRWQKIEDILDRYGIRPLVGVIPHNDDPETRIDGEDSGFWEKAGRWQKKGWAIALHGFNHCCSSASGGINPVHNRSEFAGLPFEDQRAKIEEGYRILTEKGLRPEYFFAPSHTYDETTLRAIKEVTPIRKISDTMGRKPYLMKNGMTVIPCQAGRFRDMPLGGYWTFCYHPNTMTDEAIEAFGEFIAKNREQFISFDEVPVEGLKPKGIVDRMLGKAYLIYRKRKH